MKYVIQLVFLLISFQAFGQAYLKTDIIEYVDDVVSINLDYEIFVDSIWTQEFGIRYDMHNATKLMDKTEVPKKETHGFWNMGINYGWNYHLKKYAWIGLEASYQYHNIKRSNYSCESVELIGDVYKCNGFGPKSNIQKTHSYFINPHLKLSRELFNRVLFEPYAGLLFGYHQSTLEGKPFEIFEENESDYRYSSFLGEQILNSNLTGILSGFQVSPKFGIKIGIRIQG